MADGKIDFYKEFSEIMNPYFLRNLTELILYNPHLKEYVTNGKLNFLQNQKYELHNIELEYFIALNVIPINWYYDGFLNQKRATFYGKDSGELKDKIVGRFFDQLPLMPLIVHDDLTDFMTYCPITFGMECLSVYINQSLIDFYKENRQYIEADELRGFEFDCLNQCIMCANSIVEELKSSDLNSATATLRTLVERYVVYLVLKDNIKAVREYNRLMEYKRDYYYTGNYSQKCYDEVEQNGFEDANMYVNYSWLREVEPCFCEKNCNFNHLVMCCEEKYLLHDDKQSLKGVYRRCDVFVHGGVIRYTDDWTGFAFISFYASKILADLANHAKKFLKVDSFTYNGIDLQEYVKKCNCDLGDSRKKSFYSLI